MAAASARTDRHCVINAADATDATAAGAAFEVAAAGGRARHIENSGD